VSFLGFPLGGCARPQWIAATAIGLTAGFGIGSAVDYRTSLAALIVQGAISGLAVGVAQALVLRYRIGRLALSGRPPWRSSGRSGGLSTPPSASRSTRWGVTGDPDQPRSHGTTMMPQARGQRTVGPRRVTGADDRWSCPPRRPRTADDLGSGTAVETTASPGWE